MTSQLPECETLILKRKGARLDVILNRPDRRNAMNGPMNLEMRAVFDAIRGDRGLRVVVLRGAGGWFCAGGDMRDRDQSLKKDKTESAEEVFQRNRGGGDLFRKVNDAGQAVIAIVDGAAVGGGFGLACTADITIAHADAVFAMPETSIGVPPAQIVPYVVRRIGFTEARRLAVTGIRFKGAEAVRIGLAQYVCADEDEIQTRLDELLTHITRCGPLSIAATKEIMFAVGTMAHDDMIDFAARKFADCVLSDEGREGTASFLEKRKASWASEPI